MTRLTAILFGCLLVLLGQAQTLILNSFWSGAAVFSPTDISGLQAWWKADSLSLNDNDPVASWPTAGGPARTATQAVEADKPLFKTAIQNGKPIVRFDGVSDRLIFTTTSIPSFTVFIGYKMTSKMAFSGPLWWRTASENGFMLVSNESSTALYRPNLIVWNGSIETATKTGPTTYTFPYGFVLEDWDSSPVYFKNGVSQTLINGETGFNTQGGQIGKSYNLIGGDVGEIIVYDSALSAGDKANVRNYLNARWAVY